MLTLTLTSVTKQEGKVGSGTRKKKESIPLSPLGVRSPGRNGNEDEKHLGWRRGGSGNKRRLTQELIDSMRGEISKCSEVRMNPLEKHIDVVVGGDKINVSMNSTYSSTTRYDEGDDYTADPQALKRVLESSAFIAGSTNDQSIRDDDHTADPLALKRVLESSDFVAREVRDNNEAAGNATVADALNNSNGFLVNELADDSISRPHNRRITADIDDIQILLGGINDESNEKMEDVTCEILSIAKKDKNRRITADLVDLNYILSALDEDEDDGKRGGGSAVVNAVKSFPISKDTADMSGPQTATVKPRSGDKESELSSSGGGSNRRLTADISELRSVFADVMEGGDQEEEAASAMKPSTIISPSTKYKSDEVEGRLKDKESESSSSGGGNSRRLTADIAELEGVFADVMEGGEQEEESSDNDITTKWKNRFSSSSRFDRRQTADITEVNMVLAGLEKEILNATTTQRIPLPSPPSPPRGRFESNQKSSSLIPATGSFTSSPVNVVREDTSASPSVDNLAGSVDEAMSNATAPEENNGSPDPVCSGESQEEKSNTKCTQARRDSLHFLTDHFVDAAASEDMPLSPSGLAGVGTSSLKSCLSSKKRSRQSLPAPNMMDKSTPRKKPFVVEQDVGSGRRVGFGTLSAVEFRSGSPSTKLTPMPTRAARAAFPLDGRQNDSRLALRNGEDEDEDTATNTMILDEWEEEAKAAESLRVAQAEAAAAKRGSPSPSSRRDTLMPPRQKPFNVQGLVKNLQQEESFCDSISFTDGNSNDCEQQQSLVCLPDGSSSNSVSASTCGTAAAPLSPPISMKVGNSSGCGNDSPPPKSSPVIRVAITVKRSPQKVIGPITSPLRHAISSKDESFCSEDMDISDVVSPLVSNMSPKMPFKNVDGKQKRKKGASSTTATPSSLRDITNQVDLYENETEMSLLSSNHDGGFASDGEEDSDQTQQLEPTLGGLLKGLEAEGAAAAAGKCFSVQTQIHSDGIENDRKEDRTMELEPSLGGVLANLAQTEHSSPSVAVRITTNDSSNSFSIVPDSHVGLTPNQARLLERTVDNLMLLNMPDTLMAKSKDKSGSEEEEAANSNSKHVSKHPDTATNGGTVELVVESKDSTRLSSASSVEELKEDEGNDVVITTTDETTGRCSDIVAPASPLALSVVMEEDESDLRHSTEFTESRNNKRSSNGEAVILQPLSADICVVTESSLSSNVISKTKEQDDDDSMVSTRNNESLDDGSQSTNGTLPAVPKPSPPPPLSFESILNFCMPEEYMTEEVQSALLQMSSSVKESSGKRGDMVRTLLRAVELHLLTYATEELLHQLAPKGVKQMADALLENKADQPIVRRIELAAAGVPEQDDEKLGDQLGIMSGQVRNNVMTSLFTSEMRWIDMLSARTSEVASEIDDKAHSLLRGKAYLELLDKQLDAIEEQIESDRLKKEMAAKEAEAKIYAKIMADIDTLCKEKEELEERMKRQEEVQTLRKRCAEAEEALTVIEREAYEEEDNVIDLESKISLIRGLHNWGNPLKLWSSEITIPFAPCCSRKTVHAFMAKLSGSGNATASVIPLAAPTASCGGPSGRRKRALVQKNMDVVPMSTAAEKISAVVFDDDSGIFSPSGAGGSILSTVKYFSDIPFAVTALQRIQGRSNSLVSAVDWLVKTVGLLCTVERCGKGEAGSAILHVDLKGKGTLSFVVDAGCASLCFEPKLCVKERVEIDEVILNNAKQSAQRCMASSGSGITFLRCVDFVCQVMGLSSVYAFK